MLLKPRQGRLDLTGLHLDESPPLCLTRVPTIRKWRGINPDATVLLRTTHSLSIHIDVRTLHNYNVMSTVSSSSPGSAVAAWDDDYARVVRVASQMRTRGLHQNQSPLSPTPDDRQQRCQAGLGFGDAAPFGGGASTSMASRPILAWW